MALDPKRARFVAEYLIDLSAKEAAIRAGYSVRRAKQTGHELLLREDVQAAVKAGQSKVFENAQERGRDARAELEEIAFMEIGGLLKDAPAALLGVKRAALVDVLKLDGRFTDHLELSGKVQTEDTTPDRRKKQVMNELSDIFGNDAGAAKAKPGGDNPLVHKGADRSGGGKLRAPQSS